MHNMTYIDLKVRNLKIIIGIVFVRALNIRNVLMLVNIRIEIQYEKGSKV